MARAAPNRVLLNIALDSALACLALPLALLLADPGAWPPGQWWPAALLGAVAALQIAGLPLRLARQYWRYAGLPDMLAIAGAAVGAALLFWAALLVLGAWRPGNAAFPAIHAVVLGLVLGAPRVLGRLHQGRRTAEASDAPQPVLLVGDGDSADLFIRALAGDRQPGYRVTGLLALRERRADASRAIPFLARLPTCRRY